MGCAASSSADTDTRHRRPPSPRRWTPPPRDPTPPPPRYPTPPPREPTPPPREPTPPPREPTPPPREPTPPPREPTPPPREPTPPPREPTPPPREPTPPPREPTPPPREPTPPPREPTPPPPPTPREETVDGYTLSDIGVYERTVDLRERKTDLDKDYSEYPTRFKYTDTEFGLHQAIQGETGLEWKRPGEFLDKPTLFSDGTTRFDIGQGCAGTCWFLSMVAGLADRPELFHRVVPKDAWNPDHGTFTCFFWRYGEWEPVVIDDYLPVIYGNVLWGAKSKDDDYEIWPALLEKAFARFHGNYNAIYGGQSGDAHLALTSGCSLYYDCDNALEADSHSRTKKKSRELHTRIKNACRNGAILATEVPAQFDNFKGLVGGHAYSLTGATSVKNHNGEDVHLVRVRNPWGKTEWTGPWRDEGPEWDTIPKNAVKHIDKEDGEFWLELGDFIKCFSGVTICSLVPDFDKDGCSDALNFCTTIFGDWVGEKAAGFQHRINNPRYLFFVSDEGMDEDGLVPVVVQICQKMMHRKQDKTSIRVDLYKVDGLNEQSDQEKTAVVELLGETTNVYKKERQMTESYKVEPGYYMVLPSTIDAGQEKEFLIRIYTPCPIQDTREIDRGYAMMQSKQFVPPPNAHVDTKIRFCNCEFGRWVANYNAGGQIARDRFWSNPMYFFEVPNRGKGELVNLTLMQKAGQQDYPIGVRVFPYDGSKELHDFDPSLQQYLYQQYDACPETVEGNKGAFIVGSEASVTHELPCGSYIALLHMDDEDQETSYALLMRSSSQIQTQKFNWA